MGRDTMNRERKKLCMTKPHFLQTSNPMRQIRSIILVHISLDTLNTRSFRIFFFFFIGSLFHMENERAFESINFIGVIYMSDSAGNMQKRTYAVGDFIVR